MQMQIQIRMQMRKLHQLRSASAQHSAPACECMQNWIDAIMMIANCWCSEKRWSSNFSIVGSNGDISLQFCNVSQSLKLPTLKTISIAANFQTKNMRNFEQKYITPINLMHLLTTNVKAF